jgi:hypothetical protein
MEMTVLQHEFRLIDVAALKPHEEVDAARVRDLAERLGAQGVVEQPIVADARTLVVIDGHHRLAALKALGAKRAPVHLVDYLSEAITVETWRPGEKPPSKSEVVARALSGALFPIKSTRHPSVYGLRDVRTPLDALR